MLWDICPQLQRISQLCLWGCLHHSPSPSASSGLQSPAPMLPRTHKPQKFNDVLFQGIAAMPQSMWYCLWNSQETDKHHVGGIPTPSVYYQLSSQPLMSSNLTCVLFVPTSPICIGSGTIKVNIFYEMSYFFLVSAKNIDTVLCKSLKDTLGFFFFFFLQILFEIFI